MTFSQLLVLLEVQWLLSCAENDRDIRTQTSAEHANQTEDSGSDSGELREVTQPHVVENVVNFSDDFLAFLKLI